MPYQIVYILIASPAQWEKLGKDWAKFNENPSGTGPFKFDKLVPRQRVEFVPNKDYWDKQRVPEDRSGRAAAVARSRTPARRPCCRGQVDWIEQPSPDAVPQLKSAGMQLVSNGYPHIWPYHPSVLDNSPFNDIRVRKALNLAIDRDGIVSLMGGLALPAKGHVLPDSPWFGKPSFEIKYDPDAAKKMLAEAGYGPSKPLASRFAISASGSGQMLPLPMNEYMQQNFADVGVKLDFDVTEWQALIDRWRAGAKADVNKGIDAINVSYTTQDPFSAFVRFLRSDLHAPAGVDWGFYADPEMDKLLATAQAAFDAASRNAALARVHEKMVERRGHAVGRARCRAARDEPARQGLRAGEELVPGPDAGLSRVSCACHAGADPPPHPLCPADRDRRHDRLLLAGPSRARRSARCGRRCRCAGRCRGRSEARLRLRQAAAGAIREVAVACRHRAISAARSRPAGRWRRRCAPRSAIRSSSRWSVRRSALRSAACSAGSPAMPRAGGRQERVFDRAARRFGAALLARHGAGHPVLGRTRRAAGDRHRPQRRRRYRHGAGRTGRM